LRRNEAKKLVCAPRRESKEVNPRLLKAVQHRLSAYWLKQAIDAKTAEGSSERAATQSLGFRVAGRMKRDNGPEVGERLRSRLRRNRQRQMTTRKSNEQGDN
jgi:hypothetical protein